MSLLMEEIVLLVNASAGGGSAGRVWDGLLRDVPQLSEAHLILAGDRDSARDQLDDVLKRSDLNLSAVVALGGDGTVHLVINRLLETGSAARVACGFVPAGTGSDLARTLGVPTRPIEALSAVLAAEPRPIDALEVTLGNGETVRRYSVNITSTGVSGSIIREVEADKRRGPLSYLLMTVKGLLRYKPQSIRVLVDGEEVNDGPLWLVAAANGRYFGRGMKVAPDARPDDGEIDVVVVPPLPLWQLPWRLSQFYRGVHVHLPFVRTARGREVRIEPQDETLLFELDGEPMPAGPASVRILPGALRVLA